MKENLVLVGNGMAGMRTIEELLKLDPDRFSITVFGAEPHGNYNRIMLSPMLANEKTLKQIMLHDDRWYSKHGIDLQKGQRISSINRDEKVVVTEDGSITPYDKLILATGSSSFMLPIPGSDKAGVVGFRDIKDVEAMIGASEKYKNAVVIGGGLLGLEAANGLMKRGMDVTVVHIMDILMERQLDTPAANMLQKRLEDQGMKFLMASSTSEVLGDEHITGLKFKDGSVIDTDLLVMAVGIKPNVSLGQESGLSCERAILVNDMLQSEDPSIYVVGECAQHRGIAYGLVAPLFEQAAVAARHLAGLETEAYAGTITSTMLKVTGIDLFSAGIINSEEACDELIYRDLENQTYKKLIISDHILVGAVLYGDVLDGAWYFDLIQSEADISDIRDYLIFGQTMCLEIQAANRRQSA